MKRFCWLWIPLLFATASVCQSHQTAHRVPEASTRHAVTVPGFPSESAGTASPQSIARTAARRAATRVPKNFSEYASELTVNGERCVVGAMTDEDGMNQRPLAYTAEANGDRPLWIDHLALPPNTFQSRATHCTSSGHSLFVLLQSDTQSEQTLSQTLLRVVKIDLTTGSAQRQQDIEVPGAFSAWVDEGSEHFQWRGGTLIVSGTERPQSSPNQPSTFTVRMDADLKPRQGNKS